MSVQVTADLVGSAATFRRGLVAKASFVLLNQFDLVLTLMAMSLGLYEINPFMRYLLGVPVLLITFKFIIPAFIAWLAPGKLLLPSIALLGLFVVWNIKELVFYLR